MTRPVAGGCTFVIVVALLAGCGRLVPGAPGQPPAGPPAHVSEGVVSLASPAGQAAAELVAGADRITPDGHVTLRVHNRGNTAISYGRPIQVERWDGQAWVETADSRDSAWTMELLIVQAGQAGVEQRWPFREGHRPEPGWYRFTKQVQAEPASGNAAATAIRARVLVSVSR